MSTFYSYPTQTDVLGQSHDGEGFISIEWLRENTPLTSADVFLCGPKPFLRIFVRELSMAGVPAAQIHYEIFGPADELIAA